MFLCTFIALATTATARVVNASDPEAANESSAGAWDGSSSHQPLATPAPEVDSAKTSPIPTADHVASWNALTQWWTSALEEKNPVGAAGTSCSKTADCPLGTYCDGSHNCYQCSYITRARCDEVSGSCCGSDFFINCGDRHGCQCNNNADCPCGSYCSARTRVCQPCDFAHKQPGRGAPCDSIDNKCCSQDFHDRCPASPFACPDDPSVQVDCHLPNFASGCA